MLPPGSQTIYCKSNYCLRFNLRLKEDKDILRQVLQFKHQAAPLWFKFSLV